MTIKNVISSAKIALEAVQSEARNATASVRGAMIASLYADSDWRRENSINHHVSAEAFSAFDMRHPASADASEKDLCQHELVKGLIALFRRAAKDAKQEVSAAPILRRAACDAVRFAVYFNNVKVNLHNQWLALSDEDRATMASGVYWNWFKEWANGDARLVREQAIIALEAERLRHAAEVKEAREAEAKRQAAEAPAFSEEPNEAIAPASAMVLTSYLALPGEERGAFLGALLDGMQEAELVLIQSAINERLAARAVETLAA